MTIPPEVSFHRYFQQPRESHRAQYRGKYDLSAATLSDFERVLLLVQVALNEDWPWRTKTFCDLFFAGLFTLSTSTPMSRMQLLFDTRAIRSLD
jgi:hypothetical protein